MVGLIGERACEAGFLREVRNNPVVDGLKFGCYKIFMKTLLISIALLSSISASAALTSPNQIRFVYEPYESGSVACSHKASASNPYDLDIVCADKSVTKKFTVHLALSKYTHPTPPTVSYELLYWVNGNGATTWFHLRDESALMMLESSQSINNESASLRIQIKLPAKN